MNAHNQFCQLAHFSHRGAHLNYEGLKIIDYYDYVSIVTVEGGFDNRLKSSIIDSKSRTQINANDDGVWISKYPKYNSNISKYVIILRVIAQDQQVLKASHAFCALISNLIILVWSDTMDLQYLGSLQQKIVAPPGDSSRKIAALLALPKHNPNDSYQFEQCLSKQGLGLRNFQHLYCNVKIDNSVQKKEIETFLESGGSMIEYLFKTKPSLEQNTLINGCGNPDLPYGTIIKSYAENLLESFNQTGMFQVSRAEDQIEVEQQFDDYILAIQKYNTRVKGRLSHEPIEDIHNATKDIRQEIQNQNFYKQSPYYAEKMTVYMDRKQQQLALLNQQLHDSKNLNLLQNLSNDALKNVKKNKSSMTPDKVNNELNTLIQKYNHNAVKTANKDKLLTEFLDVFTPTLFQQSEVQQRLNLENSKIQRDNQKMQKQIQNLQKKYKKSGKCCNIM